MGLWGTFYIQTTHRRLLRMDMQLWRFMEWETMWGPFLGRQEKSLRSGIQSFKYLQSLSSKLKLYFRFSVLHRGRKSRVGHTKSIPCVLFLLKCYSHLPTLEWEPPHTRANLKAHYLKFLQEMWMRSPESPKQSRVQQRKDRERSRMGSPLL